MISFICIRAIGVSYASDVFYVGDIKMQVLDQTKDSGGFIRQIKGTAVDL
ncbi:MAG: hypothetical protein K2K17_05100 [Lachnospiraceae bacterium]|nr:hypothetical protein [Lachnospiraceae bacterium]